MHQLAHQIIGLGKDKRANKLADEESGKLAGKLAGKGTGEGVSQEVNQGVTQGKTKGTGKRVFITKDEKGSVFRVKALTTPARFELGESEAQANQGEFRFKRGMFLVQPTPITNQLSTQPKVRGSAQVSEVDQPKLSVSELEQNLGIGEQIVCQTASYTSYTNPTAALLFNPIEEQLASGVELTAIFAENPRTRDTRPVIDPQTSGIAQAGNSELTKQVTASISTEPTTSITATTNLNRNLIRKLSLQEFVQGLQLEVQAHRVLESEQTRAVSSPLPTSASTPTATETTTPTTTATPITTTTEPTSLISTLGIATNLTSNTGSELLREQSLSNDHKLVNNLENKLENKLSLVRLEAGAALGKENSPAESSPTGASYDLANGSYVEGVREALSSSDQISGYSYHA